MNVIFFTQDRWAFGNVHHSLEKVLYQYGICSELVNFCIPYRLPEFQLLNEWADLFITQPDAVLGLASYGVPYDKIAAVAHAQWDILKAREADINIFYNIRKYAVVSDELKEKSKDFGILREPDVLKVGILRDKYILPPSKQLKKIGYAGAYSTINYFGKEIKRSYLVDRILEGCKEKGIELEYIKHDFYIWQSMPSYYKNIDLLIVTSSEEGAGLPYMETLASGRGIISTEVGYAKEEKVGNIFPIDEEIFVKNAINKIDEYVHNPNEFFNDCIVNQKRSCMFDWKHRVMPWVEFILK